MPHGLRFRQDKNSLSGCHPWRVLTRHGAQEGVGRERRGDHALALNRAPGKTGRVTTPKTSTVLDPTDEYPHDPGGAQNYNESMYFNAFDLERELGGWFRIGNRVNEGYAEMSVCLYLPGRRVAFMFARPHISTNDALDAGGLRVDVIEPLARLRVTYEGEVVMLDEPDQMTDPRRAFRDNPHLPANVALDFRGVSPVWGGRPVRDGGADIEVDPAQSFATAHYEQHMAVTGTIVVGDEAFTLDGLGLRDKSWGPR